MTNWDFSLVYVNDFIFFIKFPLDSFEISCSQFQYQSVQKFGVIVQLIIISANQTRLLSLV